MDRLEQNADYEATHPIPSANAPIPPDNAPTPGGSRQLHDDASGSTTNTNGRRSMVVVDDQGRRRLDYSSLCNKLNSFVATTHDDWNYNRWNDRTTYYAYVSNHPACPRADGTWFWTDQNAWSCFKPDHDANIEFAYGNCFGRCRNGCGSRNGAGAYTYDCLDHDSCIRFGHSLISTWCNDEFLSTADDTAFAPRCI